MLRFVRDKNSKSFMLQKNLYKFVMLMLIICKYLIRIKFHKAVRPLVLIMPEMSGHVQTFKAEKGDKDKNNKLMAFRTDDEKLLE